MNQGTTVESPPLSSSSYSQPRATTAAASSSQLPPAAPPPSSTSSSVSPLAPPVTTTTPFVPVHGPPVSSSTNSPPFHTIDTNQGLVLPSPASSISPFEHTALPSEVIPNGSQSTNHNRESSTANHRRVQQSSAHDEPPLLISRKGDATSRRPHHIVQHSQRRAAGESYPNNQNVNQAECEASVCNSAGQPVNNLPTAGNYLLSSQGVTSQNSHQINGAGASTLADNYNGALENRSLSYPDENKHSGENINLFARSFSNDQGTQDLVFATVAGPAAADEESNLAMESEKLKVRLLSAWNNVKNGWTFGKRKASFTSPHPIWLLGVKYDSKGSSTDSLEEDHDHHQHTEGGQEGLGQQNINYSSTSNGKDPILNNATTNNNNGSLPASAPQLASQDDSVVNRKTSNDVTTRDPLASSEAEGAQEAASKSGQQQPDEPGRARRRSSSLGEEITEQSASLQNFSAFKLDFSSRMWFTYRKDFPALPETKSTSDTGWGCMLRSGQMMLAQAFLLHFLSRDWRFQGKLEQQQMYLQILRWFDDSAGLSAPFSLHTLVDIGTRAGKNVGDWYGPSSVAYVLREALDCAKEKGEEFKLLEHLSIYVAQDCTVYKNDVMQQCFSDDNDKLASIILVPVRLGGDSLNSAYWPLLQELFHADNCVGIIGGKPRHSLYFVGYQKEKLLYLDPHFCQSSVDMRATYFPTDSFRCSYPRKMGFGKMDPSCTLGFYCRDRYEFMRFCFQMTPTTLERGEYPMFVISSSSYQAVMNTVTQVRAKKEKILRVHHLDPQGNATTQAEDFVFLEVKANTDFTDHRNSTL